MNPLSKLILKGVATFITLSALSTTAQAYDTYRVSGARIFKNNVTSAGWIPRGLNMMNQFDRRSADTNAAGFNVNIVRETVFDFKDITFGTGTTLEWDASSNRNVTLHGLRNLVNDNRANGKVTILCPFSWDGFTPIAGANPYDRAFFNDGSYNNRLYALAEAFKDDTDVWISTWNEPYGGSWTNASWDNNQLSMIQAIRNAGNNNPIVVGGTEWANSMQEFLDNGQSLLNASPTTPSGSKNIIFDWHAYKYMEWYDQATIEARIQEVKNKGLCMIMGEYGPRTSEWDDQYGHHVVDTNPVPVQNAVINKKIGVLAWYFKRGNDGNCLVWGDGTPKNDVYNWYNTVKGFLNTMSTVTDPVGSSAGPNLVTNPGFEAQQYNTQTPTGWSEWSNSGGVNSAYSESNGGSNSGNYHGTFWNGSAYNINFYQVKTGLANGNYTLRVRARSGGIFSQLILEAKGFGGTNRTANIPTSSSYQVIEITNINVSNGQCNIGLWGVGNAGSWAHFDDFEFLKQ